MGGSHGKKTINYQIIGIRLPHYVAAVTTRRWRHEAAARRHRRHAAPTYKVVNSYFVF